MVEPKIRLSLLVPGAGMLSSQECEENPKESYDEHRLHINVSKDKGKHKKEVKQVIVVKTRKQKTATQSISISKEAYDYMVETAPSSKLQRTWNFIPVRERLKAHFDQIAHDLCAIDYTFEIFGD